MHDLLAQRRLAHRGGRRGRLLLHQAGQQVVRGALQQMPSDRASLKDLIEQVDALLTEHFPEFITAKAADGTSDSVDASTGEVEFDFTTLLSTTSDAAAWQGATKYDILLPVGDSLFLSLSAKSLNFKSILHRQESATIDSAENGTIMGSLHELDTHIIEGGLFSVAYRQAVFLLKSHLHAVFATSPVVVVVRVSDTPIIAAQNTRVSTGGNDITPCVVCMDLIVGEAVNSVNALANSVHKIFQQVSTVVQGERNTNNKVIVLVERVAPLTMHNAVAASVATVIVAVTHDMLSTSSSCHFDGLSQIIRMWRALPNLLLECSAELIHALLPACNSHLLTP